MPREGQSSLKAWALAAASSDLQHNGTTRAASSRVHPLNCTSNATSDNTTNGATHAGGRFDAAARAIRRAGLTGAAAQEADVVLQS